MVRGFGASGSQCVGCKLASSPSSKHCTQVLGVVRVQGFGFRVQGVGCIVKDVARWAGGAEKNKSKREFLEDVGGLTIYA